MSRLLNSAATYSPPQSAPLPHRGVECLLLDLDGTLAASLPVMWLAYQDFLNGFGKLACRAEFNALNGPPLAEIVQRLQATHALPDSAAHLLQIYQECIDQHYQQVLPNPGAHQLLQTAQQNNICVGLVTSNQRARAEHWLRTQRLDIFFDFIVSGDEVQQGKPYPEPYLLALKKAQVSASNSVAIEDSTQGVQAAVTAGIPTYWLQTTESTASLSSVDRHPLVSLIQDLTEAVL